MNLWWLDTGLAALWSPEERRARMGIYGIAIPIFLLLYVPEVWLSNRIGIDKHIGALICGGTALPAAVYLAYRFCVTCWPDLMRKADANAAKRQLLKRSRGPAQER